MNMKHLVIRNVGPLKSIDVRLNKVNVFIGPQGSGKSTLAKIISFCAWLEKVNDATDEVIKNGIIQKLKEFHRLNGFFTSQSAIAYEGENISFFYNLPLKRIMPLRFEERKLPFSQENIQVFYAKEKTVNPKVVYIPAERNFVSVVPKLKKYAEDDDSLQSFINDWYDAKSHYTEEHILPIINLGVNYYYNQSNDRDILQLDKEKKIQLSNASSGFQSIVPLAGLVNWMSMGIYEENKPFSPEENQRLRDILTHLSGSTSNSESQMQLMERLRGFIKGKVYSHTQFIIEEPEQNLFPETQMDFLYFLLSEINHGRNHHLVLTTHSPYVLYALNNCMLAWLVKDKIDKDETSQVKSLNYVLNPSDVSVWSLKQGYLRNDKNEIHKTIQDNRGLIRKNYFNEVMKKVMGDFNTLLNYDD